MPMGIANISSVTAHHGLEHDDVGCRNRKSEHTSLPGHGRRAVVAGCAVLAACGLVCLQLPPSLLPSASAGRAVLVAQQLSYGVRTTQRRHTNLPGLSSIKSALHGC